ncbi:polygalacturonase isoform X1 [Vigna radiata var. radiata]|uniref:endo-polygalacturonase n=1 Tax=Vigna radiata var. radiata TaxID=3916 RepID=A0A1S3U0B1_VIGRR|nr:polygalacturonase isoform X1 [Vigna radiata var. radiata]
MSPKSVSYLSLFITMFVSSGVCFASFLEDTYHLTNYQHYSVKPNNEHFGNIMRRAYGSNPSARSQRMVSVDDHGAKANDGRDDTKAFEKAWNEACSSGGVLVVPQAKIYHLKPITFSGPCQPNTAFRVYGTIKAWPDISAYGKERLLWIMFQNLTNLRVDGGGIINGNGRKWWQNSCKTNEKLPCRHAPTAVTFYGCNNLKVTNLRFKNAQQMHVRFQKCNNVTASNLILRAPGNSPNTDGIHVTQTNNIIISNSSIGTGDDCISIVSGSENVRVIDVTCGPGHGISIGSLGAGNSEAQVSNVLVNRATIRGTTNGVRIKTWQGGSGYARNIKFENIVMRNVTNPIIVDQNYCDQEKPCKEKVSAVQLSNIVYENIRGTSASEVAIKFDCSKSFPCKGIFLQDVILTAQSHGGTKTIATCENVRYVNRGKFFPSCSS